MKTYKTFFALLLLSATVNSASVVVVNSQDWRAAFLASTFSQYYDYPIKYASDPLGADALLEDVASHKPDTIYLFSHETSKIPTLSYKLRALGASIQETEFKDHFDLGQKISSKIDCPNAILVRDDFGFDALSAKHLSKTSRACILFATSYNDLSSQTIAALSSIRPRTVFVIGPLSSAIDQKLSGFQAERIAGKDEYDTSHAVFLRATDGKADQVFITTGNIIEASLLNDYKYPILVVPLNGTYSLLRTATLLKAAEAKYILAVGRGISDTAAWLKDRAGVKAMVKLGTMRASGIGTEMEKRDVSDLEGYSLPDAMRSGKISGVATEVFDLLDPLTGNVLMGNRKNAPPLYLSAEFENTGNIEYPVSLLFQVFGKDGTLLESFETEARIVPKGQKSGFSYKWAEPLSEGEYSITVSAKSDVFDGIRFQDSQKSAGIYWSSFWLKAGMYAALCILLIFASAMAIRMSLVQRKFKKHAEKIKQDLGNMRKK